MERKLERKTEIKIIIQYLRNDVIKESREYSALASKKEADDVLFERRIYENGKLIIEYKNELAQIKIAEINKISEIIKTK